MHIVRCFVLPMLLLAGAGVLFAGGGKIDARRALHSPHFVPTASMNQPRGFHTMTVLQDGRVLAVGGAAAQGEEPTAELFDPSVNSWTIAGAPLHHHAYHAATLLLDGRILVTGGKLESTSTPSSFSPSATQSQSARPTPEVPSSWASPSRDAE